VDTATAWRKTNDVNLHLQIENERGQTRPATYAEEGWTALAGWNLAVLQSRTAKNIKTKLHERAWELARNQESANQEPEIVANRELAEANWAETHFRPFLSALHDTVLQQIPFL
jgi:hypothetical protein